MPGIPEPKVYSSRQIKFQPKDGTFARHTQHEKKDDFTLPCAAHKGRGC